MAQSIPAEVQPSVLRWARQSIDLPEVAAARRIDVPDDRVRAWESGEVKPTIAQLRRAARVYKRSLAVFFLDAPPQDFDTLRDFRRLHGSDAGSWSPDLHAEYRRAHVQRDALLELAEIDDAQPSTAWRIDPLPANDERLAEQARELLLSNGPLPMPQGDRPYDHFNAWVSALEVSGVLVMATAGGRVDTDEMRAFSLYFDVLPIIVVNGSDSPRARLFSLMHEYAHLLLHTSGLCDTISDQRATDPDRILEARANAIAAAILMPSDMVESVRQVRERVSEPTGWDYDALRAAAGQFGVSAEAFLRRLVTLGRVPMSLYLERRSEFLAAYDEDMAKQSTRGGDWYRNTARDLGKGFVRAVADAHRRRVIDTYTATTYLNVKAGQIERLAATAGMQMAV